METLTQFIVCANCGALLEEGGEMVPGATPVDDKWYCGGACDLD
jgi:hypothetical protein